MTQQLTIIGASVRAAVMSARRASVEPVAADLFGDVDLQAICRSERIAGYPHGLAAWLAKTSADAWIYTGGLENYPALIDGLARRKPLYGNHGNALRRVRSSDRLADVLRSEGLRFPEMRRDADGLPCDGSWLAKTGRSSSGFGVYELKKGALASAPIDQQPIDGEPGAAVSFNEGIHAETMFYQRRIDGEPGAAIFVASKCHSQLLGITRQLIGSPWTAARPFQYAGSLGPWLLDEKNVATIRRIGETVSRAFHLAGLFGVDFILSKDTVWTIEINPRYTASVEVVERMTGANAIAWHIAACHDRLPGMAPATFRRHGENTFHGKAILFARRDVVVPPAFTAWAVRSNKTAMLPTIADIPAAGTVIARGRPVTTGFAAARSPLETAIQLQHQLAEMETRLFTLPDGKCD